MNAVERYRHARIDALWGDGRYHMNPRDAVNLADAAIAELELKLAALRIEAAAALEESTSWYVAIAPHWELDGVGPGTFNDWMVGQRALMQEEADRAEQAEAEVGRERTARKRYEAANHARAQRVAELEQKVQEKVRMNVASTARIAELETEVATLQDANRKIPHLEESRGAYMAEVERLRSVLTPSQRKRYDDQRGGS